MIQVRNLTKRYGDKAAISDICFNVDKGQVVGLLGKNGAGKSTTMNILTGYISATEGAVAIGGYDIISESAKAKRLIGYMPEQPAFYPEMRTEEHLGFICDLKGIFKNKKNRAEHILDICERAFISDVRGRMIKNLSKGYKQRVAFAAAIAGQPEVIILDEPTAGLDPSQTIEMRKLIVECAKTSTVIVSSHILTEIQAICNRIIVMNEGRIIADDSTENLRRSHDFTNPLKLRIKGSPETVVNVLSSINGVSRVERLPDVEQGAADYAVITDSEKKDKPYGDIREEIFNELAANNLPLLAASRAGLSLEDIFISLTEGTPAQYAIDEEATLR